MQSTRLDLDRAGWHYQTEDGWWQWRSRFAVDRQGVSLYKFHRLILRCVTNEMARLLDDVYVMRYALVVRSAR
ncbi:MAG TPA: hypothetical protein DCS90_04485 [Ktedonobacter sp.]|nr:hypothetical protein [Ktedonobacter sp.]